MGKAQVAWLNINYVLAPRPSFSARAGADEGVAQYVTDNPSKKLCLEILSKAAIAVQNSAASMTLNVDGGKIIEDPDFPPKAVSMAGLAATEIMASASPAIPAKGAPKEAGGKGNTSKKAATQKPARKRVTAKSRRARAKGS